MHSLRFLLSRRWLIFAVAVVALTYLAIRLGEWQFHRLDDRRERNAIIQANEAREPMEVRQVLAVGEPVAPDEEWRKIVARGVYDPSGTTIVRYQVRDNKSGVDAVVPLILDDGTALMINRGWAPSANKGNEQAEIPAPPTGLVTVHGWVRADGQGSSTQVVDQSTRAINSDAIGHALGVKNLTGFIELDTEDPAPEHPLAKVELPELDDGPHFFYGIQWWFFGALAVGGFFYLLYDEWRGQGAARRTATAGPDPDGEPDDAPDPEARI